MRHLIKTSAIPLLGLSLLLMTTAPARAATIVVFGASSPTDASATGTLTLSGGGNTLNLSLTNTSTFDGRITGLGFDLFAGDFTGNNSSGLNGYTGTSSNPNFVFTDGSLGNVPQFSQAVLDFGYVTGNSGNFSGGSPNDGLAPLQTANFMITGAFNGLTEAQLASALFVRFQRLGANGEGSDVGRGATVGTPTPSAVPEPGSMILLGTGLLAALRARKRLT